MESDQLSFLVLTTITFLSCGCGDHSTSSDALPGEDTSHKEINPVPAETVFVTTPLPALSQRDYVAPLADSYERLDPSKDGWDTEAFNDAAKAQLDQLATWLQDPSSAEGPPTPAPGFQTAPWASAELELVFEDSGIVVERRPFNAPAQWLNGREGFENAAAGLRAVFSQGLKKVKFKLFRIEPGNDSITARVLLEASGLNQDGSNTQVNAQWAMQWQPAPTLQMKRITITFFEQTRLEPKETTVFQDHTASVLSGTTHFREQLLRDTDHWRARISRNLGVDVVANHGLAIGDVNGDLLDDLYLCMQGGLPNRLYLRNPDGTLKDHTKESGADWLDYCAAALIIDIDNDGHRDLVVGQEWRILFMENDGHGRFDLAFGIGTQAQTFSLAAADYDQDGDLDLFTCGYNPTTDNIRQGAMGEPMPYHDAKNGGRNMLLRNDGNWEFNDVADEVGMGPSNNRFSFAAAWEDYDRDGNLDLYVANDYGRNNLYKQENGRFVDVAGALGIEDMSSGMSVAWGDHNLDGNMDLYVSNMFSAAGNRITYQRQFKQGQSTNVLETFQRHARGNSLFENTGDGGFKDVSVPANVTMGRWAWGSMFVDFNNDSLQDLAIANGFITAQDTGDL